MPITYTALKSPVGEVDYADWFPGVSSVTVDTNLTGYLTDAYSRTTDDHAAALWAYYRAATAVADAKSNVAGMSASLSDQGSATFPANTFAYWQAKAAGYLTNYLSLVATLGAAVASPWPAITSLRRSA